MNEDRVPLTGESCREEELMYQNNRELFYFFDKEKNCYTRRVDFQYSANQIIIKQGWDALEERIDEIREMVMAGKLSPLAYYMERSQMEVPMLSQYAGIRKWRVKRHLLPKGFGKLSVADLHKYSLALDITPEQLTKPEFFANKVTDRKELND
jgi:hypothetical protein